MRINYYNTSFMFLAFTEIGRYKVRQEAAFITTNLDIGKYGLNDGSRVYINESLCPYYRGLWGKCKGLLQDKVKAYFYTINAILRVKKSEQDKPIIITHDEDL